MAIGTGVVSRWDLHFTDINGTGTVQHLRSWEDGTTAFQAAVHAGATSAVLYAISGKHGGRAISTWEYNP